MSKNSSFIILYTCLTLLILCFFIFLVANSVVDSKKKKEAIGSLVGAFGFFTGGIYPIGKMEKGSLGFSLIPLTKNQHLLRDLYEIVKFSGKEKDIIIKISKNMIVINFKKNSIFKSDSYSIANSFKPILFRLLTRLNNMVNLKLYITGLHKDSFLIASYRAYKISDYFINKGIAPDKIEAFGKLKNSDIVLSISVSGKSKVSSLSEENTIKFGDFKFKAY